ncbi:hypothetical protein IWW48_004997 [Coemansia sp. RSA 1200]|nr:hypothetical protein IWW48_004997 [Coemansia sp. RSA 1200]
MDSEVVAERTNRAPATMVGGRRKSQPSVVPNLHEKENAQHESKDARDEEGESKDLIRQEELEKEALYKQTQQQQQQAMRTKKYTNAELNRAPNIFANKNIRQPQRFGAGLPLESRKIIKEMSGQ